MKQTQMISDPKILGGKAIIADTRISVELILDRITSGMSVGEILTDYPHLTSKQVQAALSYARNLVIKKSPHPKISQPEPITLYTHEISR